MDNWFTKEVSLGNVITLAAMLFAFYKFHIANVTRINSIEMRVEEMWNAFRKRFRFDDNGEDE